MSCKNCDSSLSGIRGLCLEHRAQIAEELADALREIMDRPMSTKAMVAAHAVLAKVRP